ncbi:MAG: FtsW/RodA/SpoVE family cell cycle protein [Butyricicoccus sp.]|nr:FtsW/RodA/SpoVE family cell cycle protein [Butyricicoccus sp.]
MRAFRSIGHYFKHTDLYLLLLALCCSGFGAVLVYSATRSMDSDKYIIIQLASVAIGFFVFILISLFDLEDMSRYWKWFLLLNIAFQLLLYTPLGYGEGGNHSWLRFGSVGIQPGEVGKVLFIFTFAAHLEREYDRMNHWRTLLGLGLHLCIIAAAVIIPSHDAGVALSYLFIFIIMLFGAGLSLKWFAGGAVVALASVPFIWQIFSGKRAYRLDRILVLFDPSINPEVAWHTQKSKLAIGAGEVFGSGFLQGNQMQHSNFPGKHTDFIFAVAGEEFGFVGCLLILGLLSLLILRLFYVSFTANSTFSAVLTIGIAGMFLSQTFENILMCIGLFPVIGITLPLFSYGGSSVITMYAALGIAAGVRMREKPSWLKR